RAKLLAKPLAFYQRLSTSYAGADPDHEPARFLLARGRANLGQIYLILGRYPEAGQQLEQATAALEVLIQRPPAESRYHRGVAQAVKALGVTQSALGRPTEAEQSYRRAIAERLRLVAMDPHSAGDREKLAQALNNLGNVLEAQGRHDQAEASFRRAIATR